MRKAGETFTQRIEGEFCRRAWFINASDSPDAVKSLVNRYLARDYSHPLVESDIKGVRFDFLKCMDLYHSKALEDLVKRLVIHPNRTYRQENPSRARVPGAVAR